MILKGKILIDFNAWLDTTSTLSLIEKENFDNLSNISKHAIIIHWLETVNIFVTIKQLSMQKWFYYQIVFKLETIEDSFFHRTQELAYINAILKVKNIYNK